MARNIVIVFLASILFFCFSSISICNATSSIFNPVSFEHRSAALELFSATDGSFTSLEETYEALRTFQILGVEKKAEISPVACPLVVETLTSPSSNPEKLFNALRVQQILKCGVDADLFEGVASKLEAVIKDASSLLDFYHSVGSLVLIKNEVPESNIVLGDADSTFHSIKALSQSDGRWRYGYSGAESSTYAAGLALEALAGVVSLASSELDESMIVTVKNDIRKLFDSLEKYDDGSFYFDEKVVDTAEHQNALSTTSSVVRGITSFSAVTPGKIDIPGDKILGLAKFFLGIEVPGTAKDLFNQIDSLACLENNRVSIPLIISLPAIVLSLSRKDLLKVQVKTVLGSDAPPVTVKLVQAYKTSAKETPVLENQELKFDPKSSIHHLDLLPLGIDIGNYIFVFRVLLQDPGQKQIYATGGQTHIPVYVTGFITVDSAEIAVLDNDLGSIETKKELDLSKENILSLSANHLQKLRLSFQLTSPLGHLFKPHQVFLKLRHVTEVEHIFVVGNSGKRFEIILDFLGLVEKFYYLSGRYEMQLTVGDSAMENSFIRGLGQVELDLPEAPEKATRPPPQPVDPYTRYGPKEEIMHIFRAPEKRPPQELSLIFLGLTVVPFLLFLVGLLRLGVNLKNFPTSAIPATFAFLFHAGLGAVLSLYLLFWLKLDLFTTLKALGFLGVFLFFVGHRTLSHLASTAAKLKAA
ncbi:Dolichyl-diphosphooligosaccharide--protein glycosyltransferase subunit [Thalictrum thalictroides]|uniref:Dolichyl-diphosphooligosaccharide--protein glycosyltransferase subunit 2 n=1 Tax=Thalictrum thalictroides TaxID=46969 RepID=A0A7J6W1G0_THATH|nr:Dolichyl-diphosphooligosaccharide--protein glycosyltransferase subunit [Thalictrum thalictroides]